MRRIALLGFAVLVFGAGCINAEWVVEHFPGPIDNYQSGFSYATVTNTGYATVTNTVAGGWLHRDVRDLVSERGKPDMVLEARPRYGEYRNGIPAMTYVYKPDPATGRTCYDAFVVIAVTGQIARYYCR